MPNEKQALTGTMAVILLLGVSPLARGQQAATADGVQRLTDTIAVVNAGGTNVVALDTGDGLVLVDSGAPGFGGELVARLDGLASNSNVRTLFNTHHHPENTGNNELFGSSGATIIAHDRTRHWISTDYWLPVEERYEPARPKAAWPTESFLNTGSMEAGGEQIGYGYLLAAHTGGDMYVYFKDSNVLAVGDVASPVRDPEHDWAAGGWIGGRVDSMDLLLEIGNPETLIVPGTGPVMTYAEFQAERELMEVVRQRLFVHIRTGEGAQDMLDAGVMDELGRTWDEPFKFLYDAARGLWGNHNKLDPDGI